MRRVILWFIVSVGLFSSCRKESDLDDLAFIRSIPSDSDLVVVGSIPLQDNSAWIICRSRNNASPGYLYRVDAFGNQVDSKRISVKNRSLWSVYDIPGPGFATLGYDNPDGDFFSVCLYSDSGDLVSEKTLLGMDQFQVKIWGPGQMLRLSNGNYVIALGTAGWLPSSRFIIVNETFDIVHSKTIQEPASPGSTLVGGIYEMPDHTIVFAIGTMDYENLNVYFNTYMLRTDFDLNVLSNNITPDPAHNETPNELLPSGDYLFMVTGRMGRTSDLNGAFVNYYSNSYAMWCSGEINLVMLDDSLNIISRQGVRNYPGNGMINSARLTTDGGFILCGTVGQSSTIDIISPTKIYLMKVNAFGDYEWSKIFYTTFPSYGVDAFQTADGGYLVCGHELSFKKRYNVMILKTDASGNI
jgi:hypothetical protein